jgi:hypothetical protein
MQKGKKRPALVESAIRSAEKTPLIPATFQIPLFALYFN